MENISIGYICVTKTIVLFSVAIASAFFCRGETQIHDVGLVLSGGGAKGAYEVGVWQVLQEIGIASNITVISGTSVGAINASLFATKPDAVERIWLESMSEVFAINTNVVGKVLQSVADTASNPVDIATNTGDKRKAWRHFILSQSLRSPAMLSRQR